MKTLDEVRERVTVAMDYRGRHRSRTGSLTMAAARRRRASLEPVALASAIRVEAARYRFFARREDLELLVAASDLLDPPKADAS